MLNSAVNSCVSACWAAMDSSKHDCPCSATYIVSGHNMKLSKDCQRCAATLSGRLVRMRSIAVAGSGGS